VSDENDEGGAPPSLSYPTSFAGLLAWANAHNMPPVRARTRFAQYVALHAIAGSRVLRGFLVFKGGNALDFVWQPNRSTQDLDFSADLIVADLGAELGRLRGLFAAALAGTEREFGVLCRVAGIRQEPPGADKTFVTYRVQIAYALPDQDPLRRRMERDPKYPGAQFIKVEISINEPICADARVDLPGAEGGWYLRVSTREDIVAEKLRALLQQPIRNRTRRQDLLDIAVLLRAGVPLNRAQVAEFLLRKAAARAVPVSRAAFHVPEIMERARQDYDALVDTTRNLFVPFDEARDLLYALVDYLDIPAML